MKVNRKLYSILVCLAAILLWAMPALAQTTGQVELVGIVEAMTVDAITVNGQVIDVTAAQINTPIEVGSVVKIEGTLNPAGGIVAYEVNPNTAGVQPGEVELVGVVESFDGTTLVINGQSIDVSGAEIAAGLTVGELAKVHATATGANTWVAREVEPFAPGEDSSTDDGSTPGEFELTGTLEEIGDGFVVISGQTVTISNAEIKDLLAVGVLVNVHVRLVDGALVASEVQSAVGVDDSTSSDTNDNQNDNSDDTGNVNENDNSGGETQISSQDAIAIVLGIYPNTTVTKIELSHKFGDKLVWEIKTSHGIELTIDAQTGVIYTIDHEDANTNLNDNSNDNGGGGNPNNTNLNDNHDDHHDDQSSDDSHDDSSGHGSNSNSDDHGSNDSHDDHNDDGHDD